MKTYSRHDFTREERAARAKVAISAAFESKEQAFLDFVLSHYVRVGVQELDQEKLTPLLHLRGRVRAIDGPRFLKVTPVTGAMSRLGCPSPCFQHLQNRLGDPDGLVLDDLLADGRRRLVERESTAAARIL